jgi:hypothetical protein
VPISDFDEKRKTPFRPTMGPPLWKLVRDGERGVAIHAVFAAAVKHSPLLGDFMGEKYET